MGPGWPAKDPGPRIFSLESSSKAESQCFPARAQEMLMSIRTCTLDLHLLGHSAMISTASNLINMMESKACHDHLGHHRASWRQLTVRGSRGWHFQRETELTTRWGFNETLIESRFRYLIGAVNTNRVAGGNFISEKKQSRREFCNLYNKADAFRMATIMINRLSQELSFKASSIAFQVLKYHFFKALTWELWHTLVLQYILEKEWGREMWLSR